MKNLVVFVHNVIFQSCIKCPEVLAIASLILKDSFFSWKDANIDKVHWIANICELTVNFRHFCWLLQCVVCYLEAPNWYIHKFDLMKTKPCTCYVHLYPTPCKYRNNYALAFLIYNLNFLYLEYLKTITMLFVLPKGEANQA